MADTVKQVVSRLDPVTGKYAPLSGGVRAFIDGIRSGLEMPWSMRDMTDAEIIERLKKRSGVAQKIAEIDAATKEKEALRAEVGRDKKKLGTPVPVDEVKHPDPIDALKAEREEAVCYIKSLDEEFARKSEEVRQKCNFKAVSDMREVATLIEKNAARIEVQLAKRKTYTQSDVDAFDKQLADWYEGEKKAVAYDQYLKNKVEIETLSAQYDGLTTEIETLRESRKKALANMRLAKGLEIGEDNLLYHNGIVRGITETNRVGNWSTAENVQVFFGLGARFSGEIRVIVVDNAESLDENTVAAISEWAESASYLVILLKVASIPEELEEGIIYLKEGEVLKA
jgi:hypothetical protein